MKRLYILTFFLIMSLTAYSQDGIQLTTDQARRVWADLLRYDECKSTLKLTRGRLDSLVNLYDNQIDILNNQINAKQKIIENEALENKILIEELKTSKLETRRQRRIKNALIIGGSLLLTVNIWLAAKE